MDEDYEGKNLEKGKNYALYLLSYRDRSKVEIIKKLRERHYQKEVVAKIIEYLEEKKILDDQKFALEWATSRVKKGFARRRIEQELREKGVDEKTIIKTLDSVFLPINEEKMALEILQKKGYLPLKPELSEEEKMKQLSKISRFLSSRGFSYLTIEKLIKSYL